MRVFGALMALLSVCGIAEAEQIPGSEFAVGNWSGGAYTLADTGGFSHCAVSAPYLSGDTLIFTVNRDVTVSVAVVSPTFRLVAGQTFPVALRVDSRAPYYVQAQAVDSDFATLLLQNFDEAMRALQGGRTLYVDSAFGGGVYDLTGSRRALQRAVDCAVANYEYAGPINPVPVTGGGAEVDKTLLFQVATDMISQMGITDSRYLSAEEMREIVQAEGVMWESPERGVVGGVIVVPLDPAQPLQSSDGADIAFLGGGCKGDMATTSRNIEVPDMEAREIRARCVADTGQTETLLTKLRYGGHALYTVVAYSQPMAPAEDRSTFNERFALRAASFLRE